ncbi:hypothetical protein B0H10DRAFT_2219865 [Mycena sp. CBHHK59/15]|nr:hypothetical protein B0H10DRAFT_2219865 [Mycena sp. CBHHK59/15]
MTTSTFKVAQDADVLNLVYEAKSSDIIAEYGMKLMEIDSDMLGIPPTDNDTTMLSPNLPCCSISFH